MEVRVLRELREMYADAARQAWHRLPESDLDVLQEIDDAVDVKGDDGFLAFFGFQEGKAIQVVVKEILGKFRMPTKVEFDELINLANTTREWVTVNGVGG